MVKAKETTEKEVSTGICNFCHEELAKGQMIRHLKSCKQRIAAQKAEAEEFAKEPPQKQIGKLFHILVEGRYLPMYWLHLEVPALATLEDLDSFLRAMWVECCEHLSAFKIGYANYSSSMMDPFGWSFGEGTKEGEEDENENESEAFEGEEGEFVEEHMFADLFAFALMKDPFEKLSTKLIAEAKELSAVLYKWIYSDEKEMPPILVQVAEQHPHLAFTIKRYKKSPPPLEYDMWEAELDKVLSVGTKFSYIYDFGSSTYLSLKVIAQREGVVPVVQENAEAETAPTRGVSIKIVSPIEESEVEEDEGDEEEKPYEGLVRVLAQNVPPVIPCSRCGKSATQIVQWGEEWEDNDALCDKCVKAIESKQGRYENEPEAEEDEYHEGLLPVVNSPRTGVCGYTG